MMIMVYSEWDGEWDHRWACGMVSAFHDYLSDLYNDFCVH